ncbi:ferritin heavy chain [Paragonimus westermani]|uniref:Ferritin n=1 Tax=Paragonimus westermani TaxID=34504 RepID=A0A5J4NMY8_9TREM|nr:ferritin heavy chain [Paragonimus westermani]
MAAKTALLLLIATCLALGWTKDLTDPFILGVELQSGFNDQVMIEYEAFYIYENMAAYFSRPEVGLHGFAKFFRKAADEEIEHARKFSEFINKRNGRVILRHIVAQHFLDDFLTEQVESTSKLRSMKARLELCDSAVFLMDQELQS